MMKVPFIDLKAQYKALHEEMQKRINQVLDSCQFVMGPEIAELEKNLSDFVGGTESITCASGSDGLILALRALNIGPGDEVITTPFSFFATVDSIINVGATPVFADIEPRTFNIDPKKIESLITKKTKAIMPVSLYGLVAEMDIINAMAHRHSLHVIEDAAQSFGALYKQKRSCTLSTVGVTSFFPAKPLGCYGDGGAVFTGDKNVAETIRQLRVHGQDTRYHHIRIGKNARMDTLQAAVLIVKLQRYQWELDQRQKVAERYTNALSELESTGLIAPYIPEGLQSSWAQYTIRVPHREIFQKKMSDLGVPTAVHYPIPMSEQPAIKPYLKTKTHAPEAIRAAQEVISLPMYPDMAASEQDYVLESINSVMKIL